MPLRWRYINASRMPQHDMTPDEPKIRFSGCTIITVSVAGCQTQSTIWVNAKPVICCVSLGDNKMRPGYLPTDVQRVIDPLLCLSQC